MTKNKTENKIDFMTKVFIYDDKVKHFVVFLNKKDN